MENINGVLPADERNVEIKARIGSNERFEERVKIARNLTCSKGELLLQRDVFFNTISGRFKLRYVKDSKALLVHYDRPDTLGPKLSKFNKTEIEDPATLEKILTASNGVKGVLKKSRLLFIHNQTRIHLDKVDDLGNFMEFEVCLRPEQAIEEGEAIAKELMEVFCIAPEDLMSHSYVEELYKEHTN